MDFIDKTKENDNQGDHANNDESIDSVKTDNASQISTDQGAQQVDENEGVHQNINVEDDMIDYEEHYDEGELRNDNVDDSRIDEQGNDEVDYNARQAVMMENNVVENNLADKGIPDLICHT